MVCRVRGAPEESSPSASEVASPESFGVQMKTPFRCATIKRSWQLLIPVANFKTMKERQKKLHLPLDHLW